jgi:arginyl-tRNA synthetase
MYELLNVHFDKFSSEAEASRKSAYIIGELKKKGLLVEDQGAQVVFLSDPLPPAIIQKSDGSTLYITRDLEEVWDRYNEFKFDKMLYCVGNEQKLYFILFIIIFYSNNINKFIIIRRNNRKSQKSRKNEKSSRCRRR